MSYFPFRMSALANSFIRRHQPWPLLSKKNNIKVCAHLLSPPWGGKVGDERRRTVRVGEIPRFCRCWSAENCIIGKKRCSCEGGKRIRRGKLLGNGEGWTLLYCFVHSFYPHETERVNSIPPRAQVLWMSIAKKWGLGRRLWQSPLLLLLHPYQSEVGRRRKQQQIWILNQKRQCDVHAFPMRWRKRRKWKAGKMQYPATCST